MNICGETPGDIEAISSITEAAFENHPHSQHTEQFIINALRAAKALAISLVAKNGQQVVGHIAFSRVTVSDRSQDWYGMGPLSVLPEHQKQGIGKALVLEGLSRLRSLGADGCILVGDPDYYKRFGFKNFPDLNHEGVPQQYVLALPFGENIPQGIVTFHQAFFARG